MGTLIGFFILMVLWALGCLAIIVLPVVFIIIGSRPPKEPLLPAFPDPPARVKPEPKPRPTRKQVEDAGPWVHPRWDGTYRWRVNEDKHDWDRDFAQAQVAATLKARAKAAPPGRGSTLE